MMSNEYCSLNSKAVIEQIFATASYFKRLLLIEYNNAWSEKPIKANNLDEKINDFISKLEKEHSIKILFIKNKRSRSYSTTLFTVDGAEEKPIFNHFVLNSINEILNFSIDDLFSKTSFNKFKEDLYLVCTNGKKDKCCSKFGIPIFKELTKYSSHVWECTHVGGDRFAPNVIHLPYYHFYGHLTTSIIADFYTQTFNGLIYLPNYRGRSVYKTIEQAAEYFLRSKTSDYVSTSINKIDVKQDINDIFSANISLRNNKKGYLIKLRKFLTDEKFFLTCDSQTQKQKTQYEMLSIENIE